MDLPKHFNAPTSAVFVPGTDDSDTSGADLQAESTAELRLRAKGLAIEEWEDATRSELIAALLAYRRKEIRPNEVPN